MRAGTARWHMVAAAMAATLPAQMALAADPEPIWVDSTREVACPSATALEEAFAAQFGASRVHQGSPDAGHLGVRLDLVAGRVLSLRFVRSPDTVLLQRRFAARSRECVELARTMALIVEACLAQLPWGDAVLHAKAAQPVTLGAGRRDAAAASRAPATDRAPAPADQNAKRPPPGGPRDSQDQQDPHGPEAIPAPAEKPSPPLAAQPTGPGPAASERPGPPVVEQPAEPRPAATERPPLSPPEQQEEPAPAPNAMRPEAPLPPAIVPPPPLPVAEPVNPAPPAVQPDSEAVIGASVLGGGGLEPNGNSAAWVGTLRVGFRVLDWLELIADVSLESTIQTNAGRGTITSRSQRYVVLGAARIWRYGPIGAHAILGGGLTRLSGSSQGFAVNEAASLNRATLVGGLEARYRVAARIDVLLDLQASTRTSEDRLVVSGVQPPLTLGAFRLAGQAGLRISIL